MLMCIILSLPALISALAIDTRLQTQVDDWSVRLILIPTSSSVLIPL